MQNKVIVKVSENDASALLPLLIEMTKKIGITDVAEITIEEGRIVIRKPLTVAEAVALSFERYDEVYKELAK